MKKRGRGLLAVLFALMFAMVLPMSAAAEELSLESKSAVLMDANTGTVLYEKNSHEAMPPASVTKIMTLLLIYEAEEAGEFDWEDTVQVSAHAASMGGSQVFLEEGEKQTAADLTKCIAIASANDAAVAMAEFVSGSEEAFVERMNRRAKELGMQATSFVNACGLDVEGHETSAYDIALMSRELLIKFPEIREYTMKWQDSIVHKTRRGESEFGLTNTNKLIQWYEGATGLKTGSTGKALYCLSGSAERDGLHLIGVVMAAPDFKLRFRETMQLLDYGFANYSAQKGLPMGQEMGRLPVAKGMTDTVSAVVGEEITMLLKKEEGSEWETKTTLLPFVSAPVAEGERVGEVVYFVHDKEVGRAELVAAAAVEKANLNAVLQYMLKHWF